jgi:hypothetical protein
MRSQPLPASAANISTASPTAANVSALDPDANSAVCWLTTCDAICGERSTVRCTWVSHQPALEPASSSWSRLSDCLSWGPHWLSEDGDQCFAALDRHYARRSAKTGKRMGSTGSVFATGARLRLGEVDGSRGWDLRRPAPLPNQKKFTGVWSASCSVGMRVCAVVRIPATGFWWGMWAG